MNIHHLKILPNFFDAVVDGSKTFEIRNNDRDFKVGDVLVLEEYEMSLSHAGGGWHTGRSINVTVTYMTDFKQPLGQVVMAIRRGTHEVG